METVGTIKGVEFHHCFKKDDKSKVANLKQDEFVTYMWSFLKDFDKNEVVNSAIFDTENAFVGSDSVKRVVKIYQDEKRKNLEIMESIKENELLIVSYFCNKDTTFEVKADCDFNPEVDKLLLRTENFCIIPLVQEITLDKNSDCKIEFEAIDRKDRVPQRVGFYYKEDSGKPHMFAIDTSDLKIDDEKSMYNKAFELLYGCLVSVVEGSIEPCKKPIQDACVMPS